MNSEKRDKLVERVRVACFEAPQARSHTEWKRRIEAILDEAAEPDPEVVSTTTVEGRVIEVEIPSYHWTGGAGPEWQTWHEHDEAGHRHEGGEKPHVHPRSQEPHSLSCDCVFCE